MKEKFLSLLSTIICAFCAIAIIFTTWPVSAEAAVGMKVRPGLGGLYKVEQPLELLITVENSWPEIDGKIIVKPDDERQKHLNSPWFTLDVKIPANTREQYSILIPGQFAASMPIVELVSGDLVLAKSRVEGAAVGGGLVAVALSENIMQSGLQTWLSEKPDSQINLKYLSPHELSSNSMALVAADVIMLDASGVPSLTENQARALKEWVHLGGTLALFDGAGAGKGELFEDISPMQVTGKKTVDGTLEGMRTGGPIVVASGELATGRAVAVENGVPLLARRELGRGQVFYCGAAPRDLSDGAREVWSTLFGSFSETKSDRNISPNTTGALVQASAYIPQLAGPPVTVLALLWLVYATVAGPLLYFLLRRIDRRDWAWALVPAVALAVAGGFYLFAPANRLQCSLSQTLATVEILAPNMAEIQTGTSVVVSRSESLTVQAANNMYAVPADRYNSPNIMPTLVRPDGDKISIDFNEVAHGSLREIHAYGLKQDFGSIEGKLYLESNRIKGDLVNKTGLDLRDCRLLLGGRVIKIGNLLAGDVAHLEETVDRWDSFENLDMLLMEMGGRGRTGEPFFRERRMLSAIDSRQFDRPPSIHFLGWHDGAPGVIEIAGKPGQKEDNGLVLVKQTIKIELAEGKFRLPAGFITPRPKVEFAYGPKLENTVKYGDTNIMVYDIGDAGIENNFTIEALDFQETQEQYACLMEIYNRQLNKWEPLPSEGKKIASDELACYLRDNKVMVRPTSAEDEFRVPRQITWPRLAVEGVAF